MKRISIFTVLLFVASLFNVSGAFAADAKPAKAHKHADHAATHKSEKKDAAGKESARKHKIMKKKK